MTPARADLERRAAAALELERRRKAYPLAYASLWDNPEPRTSQRRALLPLLDPTVLMLAILGGNRAGKSDVVAQYGCALAAGLDAKVVGPEGEVHWVRRWLARNGLPEALIPRGPDRVWVGSPSFGAAVEQIRPKFARYLPAGTKFTRWDDKQGEGEAKIPGGGVLVSKAYKQYDGDPQTWEGANPRGIILDEQPNRYSNLLAAFSRLVDKRGKLVMALTPLRGTSDWLYREIIQPAPSHVRVVHLHGGDNPHIPQDMRELMLASMPAWQRASRDTGAFTSPEGAIFTFDRGTHVLPPLDIPTHWTRWQGIDWGARSPHVVWLAEAAETHQIPGGRELLAGDIVVYRELAPRRTTTEPGISQRKLLTWAREMEAGTPEGLSLATIYRVADSEDPGAIAEAAELGLWIQGANKAAGSVALGIQLMEALLQTVDGVTMEPCRPRLFFSSACPQTIEEVEGMKWAEAREGQDPRPDPACPDHGPDAVRYALQLRQGMGFR